MDYEKEAMSALILGFPRDVFGCLCVAALTLLFAAFFVVKWWREKI